MKEISTLRGSNNTIKYKKDELEYNVVWGKTHFSIANVDINTILNDFFVNKEEYYLLAPGMVNPKPGGLGEFVEENINKLHSKHASAIAAIMVCEGYLERKDMGREIFLRKIADNNLS